MDFKEILAEKKPIIWKEVQKYLLKEGPYNFPEIVNDYSHRQGKYGRGTLVLLSCEAFGGDIKKAVRTAAAMQLSEDWLLIHDDWMDNSDERRGKPTLHKIHGDYFAVNAGDMVQTMMWKALIDNKEILSEETTFKILNEFARFLYITIKGQHLELTLTLKRELEELDYKDYEAVALGKAAIYTISSPLRLGALVAEQNEDVLKKLEEFSIPLGIGFQVRDDILNIIGEGSVYGKEIGGDIYEGKRTLLLIHLVKNTEGDEHKKVLEIMNKPREEKTPEEVEYILKLMKEKGSVDFAEKKAEEYAKKAKESFNRYFSDLPNKEAFEAAIDFFTMSRKV